MNMNTFCSANWKKRSWNESNYAAESDLDPCDQGPVAAQQAALRGPPGIVSAGYTTTEEQFEVGNVSRRLSALLRKKIPECFGSELRYRADHRAIRQSSCCYFTVFVCMDFSSPDLAVNPVRNTTAQVSAALWENITHFHKIIHSFQPQTVCM